MSQTESTPAPQQDSGSKFTFREFIRAPLKRYLDVDPSTLELAKSLREDPNETGVDRVKAAWRAYIEGEDSLEIRILTNSMMLSGMSGFILGGIIDSKTSMQNYARKHNANIFYGQYRANRHLADRMYIEFAQRGVRQGIKWSLFSGLFVGFLSTSATYRNDIYFSDCALGGALTGVIYRVQLGPRAMLVNGVVGSIFGLTFAALMKLGMKLGNTSIKEMRFYHKALQVHTGIDSGL